MDVSIGDWLTIEASHDTYGISFRPISSAQCSPATNPGMANESLAPKKRQICADLYSALDPVWASCHAALQPMAAALSKAMAQDPLVYRQVARAAMAMAARPHEHGVDSNQAARFCCKLMSA